MAVGNVQEYVVTTWETKVGLESEFTQVMGVPLASVTVQPITPVGCAVESKMSPVTVAVSVID